jgi:hypothetical protein
LIPQLFIIFASLHKIMTSEVVGGFTMRHSTGSSSLPDPLIHSVGMREVSAFDSE